MRVFVRSVQRPKLNFFQWEAYAPFEDTDDASDDDLSVRAPNTPGMSK